MSALVVISAVGALTGIILGGPRMYLSMAQDGAMLQWVNAVHPTYRTPHRAIVLQAIWASVLVLTGSYPTLFGRVIYMEWFFFALMTAGVFVLRQRAVVSAGLPDVGVSSGAAPVHRGVGGDRPQPAARAAVRGAVRRRGRGLGLAGGALGHAPARIARRTTRWLFCCM